MKKIIEINNLKKHFGEIKAVDDISFSVNEGDLFAFLGVNGAGKSTTINIISTLHKKDSGKVIIDGLDLDKNAFEIKEKIGIVFQASVLDDKLNIKENLTTRASYYGLYGKKWEDRLEELTYLLDLKDLLKRPFAKLSGGQKRRVDIARGLINRPKILFLDEPTTGLDPGSRNTIWQVITALRKENNMTVFLTTHYMEEADNANDVVIIDKGKIIVSGTPQDLKNQYSGNQVKIYGDLNGSIYGNLNLNGFEAKLENNTILVKVKDSNDAKKFIMENKNMLNDFEVIKGNMDDVFLNATGKKLEV